MGNFDFRFKGDRNYVHGTDIYNAIARYLQTRYGRELSHINLSFHTVMTHQLEGEVVETEQPDFAVQPAVICKFAAAGSGKTLALRESERTLQGRYAYDEESIARAGRISEDGQAITLVNETPYSSVEVTVAINKRLMQTIFAHEAGKWWFSRLILSKLLPEDATTTFMVRLKRHLGPRLTCSTIMVGGEPYGEVYFSMVKG